MVLKGYWQETVHAGKIQKAMHIWALSSSMPAIQLQSTTGVDCRRFKLIIREASEGKSKGKEDMCSVDQWFVCNAIAGHESPRPL